MWDEAELFTEVLDEFVDSQRWAEVRATTRADGLVTDLVKDKPSNQVRERRRWASLRSDRKAHEEYVERRRLYFRERARARRAKEPLQDAA